MFSKCTIRHNLTNFVLKMWSGTDNLTNFILKMWYKTNLLMNFTLKKLTNNHNLMNFEPKMWSKTHKLMIFALKVWPNAQMSPFSQSKCGLALNRALRAYSENAIAGPRRDIVRI